MSHIDNELRETLTVITVLLKKQVFQTRKNYQLVVVYPRACRAEQSQQSKNEEKMFVFIDTSHSSATA